MEEIFLLAEGEVPSAVRSEKYSSIYLRRSNILRHTVKYVGKEILSDHSFEFNKR